MTRDEYVPKSCAPGDTSDGYHTFDELYEHRTGILAALLDVVYWVAIRYANWPDERIAERELFKSRRHHDGGMYDGFFIVGINCSTDEEHVEWATWHCEDKWWDTFLIPEVERAPEWDGHTPKDALDRLVRVITVRPEE